MKQKLIQAFTWRLVAELMRRHHAACHLRVLQTHPGGGQYDCLSVYSDETGLCGKHLFDINLISGRIHLIEPYARAPRATRQRDAPTDIAAWFLGMDDPKEVIDGIERSTGLPDMSDRRLPPESAAVVGLRLVAEVVSRVIFARRSVIVRCGWHDSSGGEGSHPLPGLRDMPQVAEEIAACGDKWKEQMRVASRLWQICSGKQSVWIDLKGIAYHGDSATKMWHFPEQCDRSTGRILPGVHRLESILFPD